MVPSFDTTHSVEDRLRERAYVDGLKATYVSSGGDASNLEGFIQWASYYKDPAYDAFTKRRAFLTELAKYFSFSTTIGTPYVALKPQIDYPNVVVGNSLVGENKLIENRVSLTLMCDSGSFTTVSFNPDTVAALFNGDLVRLTDSYTVVCYSKLEQRSYSGSLINVDMTKFTAQLRTLMIAAGWNEEAYVTSEWVQSDTPYTLFGQKQLQLQQSNPAPQSFTEADALRYIALAQHNGTKAYAEYYTLEGEWKWLMHDRHFYLAKEMNVLPIQSTVFTGTVGNGVIATRANPKFFEHGLLNCPAPVYASIQFEPQSLGYFYEELVANRQKFMLDHTQQFTTA